MSARAATPATISFLSMAPAGLAGAVLAQVDASAQGNDMQRSVLKSHCRCSCPTERWPQACKVCAVPTWSLIWQFARLQALTAAVGGAEGRVRVLAESCYMGWCNRVLKGASWLRGCSPRRPQRSEAFGSRATHS